MKTYPVIHPYTGKVIKGMRAVPTGEYRSPRCGEWYLSGSYVEAHKAYADYAPDNKYHIAKLIYSK